MSDRQKILSRLISDRQFRADYIRAKLDVLIPSQLRALRLGEGKTQSELAELAEMKQARISAMEMPGQVNFNRETLVRMAATHGVGLIVKFVPFSEMLEWENSYSQDVFDPIRLANDVAFLQPKQVVTRRRTTRKRTHNLVSKYNVISQSTSTGPDRDAYLPRQQEGAQITLQFEQAESPESLSNGKKYTNVVTLDRVIGGSFGNDSPFRKAAAAAAGAGGSVNNMWRINVAR